MKKVLILIVALILVGGLATEGYLFYKKKGIKQLPQALQQMVKSNKTAWQYQKNIAVPLIATIGKEDVTMGNLDTDKALLKISGGAFDNDKQIQFANPDKVPNYLGNEIDTLSAPIEITVDGGSARLNEKATVTFVFDKSQLTSETEKSLLRVAYYNGEKWDYIKPTTIDFEKGLITFETYHFSLLGATKIKDETKLTEDWIHSKTIDKQMRDNINKLSDHVSNQIIDLTLEKMGISDKTLKGKILADFLKDDDYREIYDSYSKGDMVEMNQKIAVLAGKKIAEIVPESAWKEGLKNLTESTEDVAAVAKAAGYAAEGQYKDAAKIIGEQIADKFLITTAGKIAVEVVKGQVEDWKNSEIEAAYEAYRHGANGVFYGYNVDKGDFDGIWDQMRGIRRQLEIEAIEKQNKVRTDAGLPKLTEKQMDMVREEVKQSFQKQFSIRAEKEDQFKKQEDDLRMLVEAFRKRNLLDPVMGPAGLDKGLDLENKLDILQHFAEKMQNDTNRFELSDKNGLVMSDKISVDDIALGASFWFTKPDGKKLYQKYLKDRFNIDPFPLLKNLAGDWQNGKLVITDVIVPEALKNAPKDKKANNIGCDFSMDLSELIGKEVPISISLTPQGENSGIMKFKSDDNGGKEIPFTYEDGVIKASFSEKGATAMINLEVSGEENYQADGSLNIIYKSEAGEAKILASLSANKPTSAKKN